MYSPQSQTWHNNIVRSQSSRQIVFVCVCVFCVLLCSVRRVFFLTRVELFTALFFRFALREITVFFCVWSSFSSVAPAVPLSEPIFLHSTDCCRVQAELFSIRVRMMLDFV